MRICFKKAAESFYDRLIRLRTGGLYVHAEILFSNGVTWRINPRSALDLIRPQPAVDFWTGQNYAPEQWDLLPYFPRNELKIFTWAKSQNGKRYDWLGILNFAIPLGEDDDHDLFCSEGVVYALQQDGSLLGKTAKLIDPNELHRLLTQ